MSLPETCKRLSVYIGGHNRTNGLPMYEAVVMHAKQQGLSGVTVFTGLMSFGHLKLLEGERLDGDKLSDERPVLVQIVESEEKINELLPEVKRVLGTHGLVTVEDVQVVHQATPMGS